MDARDAAVTEAYDKGAREADAMDPATHKDRKTSQGYNRDRTKKTSRFSVLRFGPKNDCNPLRLYLLRKLDDLARLLDRIAVRVEGNVERAVKDCAQVVLRSVVEAMPVDTGTASSNWSPELDRAVEGLRPARVPGAKGSTADANAVATIEAGAPVIEAFDIRKNRKIHVTNNADHISP